MIKPKILDIPKIQRTIKKKHEDFMAGKGSAVLKVSADNELAMARMSVKISTILGCLIGLMVYAKFNLINVEKELY